MSVLSNQEVQQLYKDRPRKKEVDIGIKHHDRLRFHTETVIKREQLVLNPYYHIYERWIIYNNPELLPKDKAERFRQLITYPLPTIELTESIFSHLSNVFKAQDSFFRYEFKDSELESDWQEYRDKNFWKNQGFQAMMCAIDSVWIVDLSEQKAERPEPKDRLIDVRSIIDISVDEHNNCDYIIFRINKQVFVYDEMNFMVYSENQNKLSLNPIQTVKHGLGYCPARMIWSDQLVTTNTINKKAPLTNVLGDLDWLLTCHVFKKYMEISNSYPILAAWEPQEDYKGKRFEKDRGMEEEYKNTAGSNIPGPGTVAFFKPPLPGESDPMTNPFKYITPDINNLKYHVDNVQDKRDAIFYSVVGKGGEESNDQAKNEKQIMASFESQTTKLKSIASNFEIIQTFADKCKIDLRYGTDALLSIKIDYGNRFFLKTTQDLTTELEESRRFGSPSSMIYQLMQEITETKYRSDSYSLARARIIQELDPLPEKTQLEADGILLNGGITQSQYIIKCQLMNFVNRFEREQANLVDFASARDYGDKMDLIKESFEEYAQEIIDKSQTKTKTVNNNLNQNNQQLLDENGQVITQGLIQKNLIVPANQAVGANAGLTNN